MAMSCNGSPKAVTDMFAVSYSHYDFYKQRTSQDKGKAESFSSIKVGKRISALIFGEGGRYSSRDGGNVC